MRARRRRRILAKAAPPAATACCASASPHQRRLPRRVRRARPRVSRVRNAPPAPDAGRRATDERVGGAARDYRIRAGRPAPLRPRRRLPPGSHQRRLPHGTRRAGICPRRVPPPRRRPPLGCRRVLPGAIRARPVPLGPRRAPVRPEAAGLPSACPHDTPSGSSGPPEAEPAGPRLVQPLSRAGATRGRRISVTPNATSSGSTELPKQGPQEPNSFRAAGRALPWRAPCRP